MVYAIVFGSVFVILIILVLVLVPRYTHGEKGVSRKLKSLEIEEKEIIHDLLIPYKGRSSQIDNILLTRKGIYVIECKQRGGTVTGKVEETYWEQTTYRMTRSYHVRTHKYRLYNPLMQNQTHINALSKLLNVDKKCFRSLICFMGGSLSLDYMPPSIVSKKEVVMKITAMEEESNPIFSESEYQRIRQILLDNKEHPKVTKEEHVNNIRKHHDTNNMIY